MVHILHVIEVVLDENDLVLLLRCFRALWIRAYDIVYSWERGIILEKPVYVLLVVCIVIDVVVVHDANAASLLIYTRIVAILAMVHELLIIIEFDIQKVVAYRTELHCQTFY
jgi:hypothetical protein